MFLTNRTAVLFVSKSTVANISIIAYDIKKLSRSN
jgi:hypothetical protein